MRLLGVLLLGVGASVPPPHRRKNATGLHAGDHHFRDRKRNATAARAAARADIHGRLEALRRVVAGLPAEAPDAWVVRGPEDVSDATWAPLANGTAKRVFSAPMGGTNRWGKAWGHRWVVLKQLAATGGSEDAKHFGEVKGELYFLELLRGRAGIPTLLGVFRRGGTVSYVVQDAGQELMGHTRDGSRLRYKQLAATRPLGLARALLRCFESFSEVGGFFLDDLTPHQFTYVPREPVVFLVDGPKLLSAESPARPFLEDAYGYVMPEYLMPGRACVSDGDCPATKHHHSCVGHNNLRENYAGRADKKAKCTDGSTAAPEARGWCRRGWCVPISAKTHGWDLGARPWALPFLAGEAADPASAAVLRDLAAKLTAHEPADRPAFSQAREWLDRAVARAGIDESGAAWREPSREKAGPRPASTSRAPGPRPSNRLGLAKKEKKGH